MFLTCFVLDSLVFPFEIGGETSQMKLDAFKARPAWANIHNEEIVSSLSTTEKELCKRYIDLFSTDM